MRFTNDLRELLDGSDKLDAGRYEVTGIRDWTSKPGEVALAIPTIDVSQARAEH